ncbi:MAG: hypothetical protein H7Z40_21515 [Phycisphaerae bacterium]|nr:hypothetical protein [Gemmatimonadaceae bacterium]
MLWIDCTAAILAGVLVLAASSWLSSLYVLPRRLLIVTGAANIAYGIYSFSLARRTIRPRALITTLVTANALWAVVCAVIAANVAAEASLFGTAHFVGEGLFVGALAAQEWRHRERLLTA